MLEPLAPGRHRVQFTASTELRAKLEKLQALLRTAVPDGDLAAIVEIAVTEKLERLEARKYARTARPRRSLRDTPAAPASRHVPAAVRRAVSERDGERCTYRGRDGRRCTARSRLEFHHDGPYGQGGDHGASNVRLLCATHNLLLAEIDYGKEAIARRIGRSAAVFEDTRLSAPGPAAMT